MVLGREEAHQRFPSVTVFCQDCPPWTLGSLSWWGILGGTQTISLPFCQVMGGQLSSIYTCQWDHMFILSMTKFLWVYICLCVFVYTHPSVRSENDFIIYLSIHSSIYNLYTYRCRFIYLYIYRWGNSDMGEDLNYSKQATNFHFYIYDTEVLPLKYHYSQWDTGRKVTHQTHVCNRSWKE